MTEVWRKPEDFGWIDTFDDGFRAAIVSMIHAGQGQSALPFKNNRRTRKWLYRARLHLQTVHANQTFPVRAPFGAEGSAREGREAAAARLRAQADDLRAQADALLALCRRERGA